jgi:hypothetical protein
MFSITGDIEGKLALLRRDLVHIRCFPVNESLARNGDAKALLPVISHVLHRFSRPLAELAAVRDLVGKKGRNYVEGVIKFAREHLGLQVVLTSHQFMANGFVERKLMLLHQFITACRDKHAELMRHERLKAAAALKKARRPIATRTASPTLHNAGEDEGHPPQQTTMLKDTATSPSSPPGIALRAREHVSCRGAYTSPPPPSPSPPSPVIHAALSRPRSPDDKPRAIPHVLADSSRMQPSSHHQGSVPRSQRQQECEGWLHAYPHQPRMADDTWGLHGVCPQRNAPECGITQDAEHFREDGGQQRHSIPAIHFLSRLAQDVHELTLRVQHSEEATQEARRCVTSLHVSTQAHLRVLEGRLSSLERQSMSACMPQDGLLPQSNPARHLRAADADRTHAYAGSTNYGASGTHVQASAGGVLPRHQHLTPSAHALHSSRTAGRSQGWIRWNSPTTCFNPLYRQESDVEGLERQGSGSRNSEAKRSDDQSARTAAVSEPHLRRVRSTETQNSHSTADLCSPMMHDVFDGVDMTGFPSPASMVTKERIAQQLGNSVVQALHTRIAEARTVLQEVRQLV